MQIQKIMKKSFIVNLLLVIIKVVFGFLFKSTALLADGVHSISDLLSDILVIFGIRQSQKPADEEHPFGHGKFEYVLSLLLGISIFFIAYNLGREIIASFNDVTQIPSPLALVVVLFVILAKLVLSRYLIRRGKEIDSEIVYASGKESFADVISSFVVVFGIIFVLIGNQYNIQILLKGDKIASIFISLLIIKIAFEITRNAIVSLLGRAVKDSIRQPFVDCIEQIDGVIKIDHLDMIAYGPYYQLLVDIRVNGNISVREGHDIAKKVSEALYKNEKVNHVVVHVNPEV